MSLTLGNASTTEFNTDNVGMDCQPLDQAKVEVDTVGDTRKVV
jgi:hypothetical protein